MLLPWFGYIGRQYTSCAGHSNSTGSRIFISTPFSPQNRIDTKHFDLEQDDILQSFTIHITILRIIVSIIGAFVIEHYLFSSLNYNFLRNVWFVTTAMSIHTLIPTIIFMLFLYSRDMTQWHSCEHRAVMLLESRSDFTKENLMRSPAALIRCGTVQEITKIELWISLSFLLYTQIESSIFSLLAIAATASVVFAVTALCLIYLSPARSLTDLVIIIMPFFIPGLPALLLPMLFQWTVMLAHPTPDKIAETLEMLHQHYTEHPFIPSIEKMQS